MVVRFLREYDFRFMTDGSMPPINDRVRSRRYGQSCPSPAPELWQRPRNIKAGTLRVVRGFLEVCFLQLLSCI